MSDKADLLFDRIRRAMGEAHGIDAREVDLRVYIGSGSWFATTYFPDRRAVDARGATRFAALEALQLKLDAHWSEQHTSAERALRILRGEPVG